MMEIKMPVDSYSRRPRWYWVITVLAGLAAAFALVAWVASLMTGPDEIQRLAGFRPNWIFQLALAVAALSETLGVAGLLMRKTWAVPAFIVSFVFTVVFYFYLLFILKAQGSLAGPIAITLVHLMLCWFAIHAKGRGWLTRRRRSWP
jgi:phage shock protein PspC (stress-responsive transcriptional regulator)